MILEMISADFSREVFPNETVVFSNLRNLIRKHSIIVNSFSRRKFLSSLLLILIGAIDFPLLADAGIIHVFTGIKYSYLVAMPALIMGLLLLSYHYFSTREFFIMNYNDWLFFGEKTAIASFQRLQFFPFRKKDITEISMGNSAIKYEIAVLFGIWFLIWFFLREGIISIKNFIFLGYIIQLRIGIVNIITFSVMMGVFLCWMIPKGRSQLKIVSQDTYVEMNFNDLSLENANKIRKILNLPSIPSGPDLIPKGKRRFYIKTPTEENLFNYNLLWKYFYILLGSFLFISGWVVQVLDLQINWSLGMFFVPIITIFGLKNLIYGWSEHFYQQEFSISKDKWENSEKQFMNYRFKTISGFKVGIKELILKEQKVDIISDKKKESKLDKLEKNKSSKHNTNEDRTKKNSAENANKNKNNLRNTKGFKRNNLKDKESKNNSKNNNDSRYNIIFPFNQLERSNFKPISWFNLILIFSIFYYLLYQSLRYYSPFTFYSNDNYYPSFSYQIASICLIIPVILIFLKSNLPSLKGNSEEILKIIKSSKFDVKKELLIRLGIVFLFLLIPTILTLQGIPNFI